MVRRILLRFLISLGISLVFGVLVSEGTFRLTEGESRQVAERFDLVIPAGTAQRIKAGEAVSSIPTNMVFVVGDTLVVHNEDEVSHQLGPIWVPPGASGSLTLQEPSQYAYACTFQPAQYIGLDVRPRLTAWIRWQGALAIALPSSVLLWLFSIAAKPIKS